MKMSILQKMLLCILLPVVLGFSALTLVNYFVARDYIEKQIVEEITLVTRDQKNELANTVSLLGSALGDFARSDAARSYLAALAEGDDSAGAEAMRMKLLQAVRRMADAFSDLRDIGVVDGSGKVVAHSNLNFIGSALGERGYIKAAMNDKPEPFTIISKANGKLSSALGLPVKSGDKIVGVVYATMALEKLAAATTDNVRIGDTGISFVYDKNGVLLMHPDKKLVGVNNSGLEWLRHMLDSPAGGYSYEVDGVTKVARFEHVPTVDWLVAVSADRDDILAPVASMFRNSLLVCAIAMLLIGCIIVVVARGISRSLGSTAALVDKIAHGDLELDAAEEASLGRVAARGDEIGVLGRGAGEMLLGLKRLFAQSEQKTKEAEAAAGEAVKAIRESEEARKEAERARGEGIQEAATQLENVVEVLGSASEELSAQIEESRKGSGHQASRMAETATAMEEMNATVLEVSRSASAAAGVASATRQKAEAGEKVVEQVVSGIHKVRERSMTLKHGMTQLSESAQSIGEIMSVIADIADQTNLLALNAAIEAARAGEAGRGFAVVADEVRKLAEKTMTATSRVDEAIRNIQGSAAKSRDDVDSAVGAIEEATACANQSGEALAEIVSMADQTADQVRAIAAASEEQSAASEEINRSISEVNSIAVETASAMDESSRAVQSLSEQAQRLNQLIEEMRRG